MTAWPLLLAEAPARTFFELARLQSLTEWWQWLLLLAASVLVAGFILLMYVYDSRELTRGLTILLVALRVLAFIGLLVFFLNLEKRSERKIVKNSRAVLLIDTSQSMGLQDADSTSIPAAPSRIEHIVAELSQGDMLNALRKKHDVVAYRFDQDAKPSEIASFPKLVSGEDAPGDQAVSLDRLAGSLTDARRWATVAGGLFVFSLLAGGCTLFARLANAKPESVSWMLLASTSFLLASVGVLALASLRNSELHLLAIVGLREPSAPEKNRSQPDEGPSLAEKPPEIDWKERLVPRGAETRLGEALRFLVNKERGGPIAGIVLLTDGNNNAGVDHTVAAAAAQDAGIAVFPVGMGSNKRPVNVRVVDLEAPPRVFPEDRFTLTGYLQLFDSRDRSVRVEFLSRPASDSETGPETVEDERRIDLRGNGDVTPVKFEIIPTQEDIGKKVYKLRVVPPEQDVDRRDNEKTATVQIVARKNKIFVMAGGPSRDYQFLRNQLYRDKNTEVNVWLQSGRPGISQEAHNLAFNFPKTADELFEYDCIVAFDPDWQALDEEQTNLLDRWVAEKAGGLIVVAGPVFTPQWSGRPRNDPRVETIKALYPVAFYSQGSATLGLGRFGGDKAWPLSFTRDGQEAEFLWLDETATKSEAAWVSFGGVYGYYAVKDPKPGARVYARFSDPDTSIDNELPIYMAGHFYGAGRVFFLGSGEMWRVRDVDDRYFDVFYTKLIRWVSQGRLLRDSSRGVLLVDKDRCLLGDQVSVRAMLTDSQHEPLTDEAVSAVLIQPDTTRAALTLRSVKDSGRAGMYAGQFTALQEGDYRVELRVPDTVDDELLTREVRVRVPDLEVERPERNDAVLQAIAEKTGGEYYVGLSAAMNREGGGRGVADVLEPQDQETYLPGTPDRLFEKLLMSWLLGLISGVLCLEWLIRRLSKLA